MSSSTSTRGGSTSSSPTTRSPSGCATCSIPSRSTARACSRSTRRWSRPRPTGRSRGRCERGARARGDAQAAVSWSADRFIDGWNNPLCDRALRPTEDHALRVGAACMWNRRCLDKLTMLEMCRGERPLCTRAHAAPLERGPLRALPQHARRCRRTKLRGSRRDRDSDRRWPIRDASSDSGRVFEDLGATRIGRATAGVSRRRTLGRSRPAGWAVVPSRR